ncbi:hypothetical protein Ocin01_01460 [Orchesella cincta]|uniref:Uncharacterized protein n=1 Tax=Orchesella cincta TaxID=48709 RepID=A0A1D2NJ36_ORCCI|nr:hypothetical protein Ocin01_01460 [Orchesella cincta]
MAASAPRLEKARGRARLIAQMLFVIHLVMVYTAILVAFFFFWVAFRVWKDETTPEVSTTINGTKITSMKAAWMIDDLTYDEKADLLTTSFLLAVVTFLTYVPQFYSATILMKGTEKNLAAKKALGHVDFHQHIQLLYLFVEVVFLMVSTYANVLDDYVDILGWRNVFLSSFFRITCMLVVDLFGKELDQVIEKAPKKEKVVKVLAKVHLNPPPYNEATKGDIV